MSDQEDRAEQQHFPTLDHLPTQQHTANTNLHNQHSSRSDLAISHSPEANLEDGKVLSALEHAPIRFLDRFEHFTWAWYSMPMTTTGLSLLLSPQVQPHTFSGLNTIAKVIYVLGLVFFVAVTVGITYRFTRWRHTLRASIVHPTEGLYVAAVWLFFSNIIPGLVRFGVPSTGSWLIMTYYVCFWVYFACTFSSALFHYILLYTLPQMRLEDMTPAWDMHSFPLLMCGTIASAGASHLSNTLSMPMLLCGVTTQGLGFLMSLFMNANYTRRMIQWGLPHPRTRPAMFIAIGPPAYTALGLLGMAEYFPGSYQDYFANSAFDTGTSMAITFQVINVMATFAAVFLWSLAFWFFCLAVAAVLLSRNEKTFSHNWWSFAFPTTGFVMSIIQIGNAFKSPGVLWVGSVATILVVLVYLFVVVKCVLAVLNKEIMWPGKDEDVYLHEKKAKTILKDLVKKQPSRRLEA